MGHGFLGMERAPWPPAMEPSDSDPVVPPKRGNRLVGILSRVAIAVVLALAIDEVCVHVFVRETTNASVRYGPHLRHYPMTYPAITPKPTVKK